jgi:molybdate transport system substrate-binding protein
VSQVTQHGRRELDSASRARDRAPRTVAVGVVLSLALTLALVAGCGRAPSPTAADDSTGVRAELVVYAATSTRDALQTFQATYQREHAVDLVFNFGSSGDLARQLVAAGRADVFLSADEHEMDRVEAEGLVAPGTRRSLLSNQLVVIEPADEPSCFTAPFEPAQLAGERVARVSLANVDTVPAGRYAKAWLQRVGVWDAVAARVLPGVDVRAALAAVEAGAADAGIVYRSDVARTQRARVVFAVPLEEGPRISYPIAAIAGRASHEASANFIDALSSPDAREVFEAHGFLVPVGPPGADSGPR